jgi:acetyltransferase-like isoleucine patch superfamily enzyme
MEKILLRRIFNRILHSIARNLPGAKTVRPFLHRLRGVKIYGNVFIGEEVYIENEFPECVEIHDKTEIAVRATIISHFKESPGRIIIKNDVYIGPNSIITASEGQTLKVGKCSVIAAGSAVNINIPPNTFVSGVPAKPIAKILVPISKAQNIEEFKLGLRRLSKKVDRKKSTTG